MKKTFYTLLFLCALSQFANAQCVPGTYTGNHGFILPDSTQFPHATLNQAFHAVIQIQVAHDTTGTFVVSGIPIAGTFVFDSITIHGVNTVPALSGATIQYTCSALGCKFLGSSTGCIDVTVPAAGTSVAGTYRINVTAVGRGVFTPTQLPIPSQQTITQMVNWYKLIIDGNGTGITMPDNFNETIFSVIDVKPNPASDNIAIQYYTPSSNTTSLDVTDIIGKKIMQQQLASNKGLNNVSIDISSLANGIYFLGIQSEGKKISKKIVVSHNY
ncbi:MAG: hypothetical protein RJA07_1298 [Bacteroidota bacterium]|jgi:hypothetical protein